MPTAQHDVTGTRLLQADLRETRRDAGDHIQLLTLNRQAIGVCLLANASATATCGFLMGRYGQSLIRYAFADV